MIKLNPTKACLLPHTDFEPEAPLTVSEWADLYRILSPETSAEPGQWHTSRVPYLREPMDAFCDPTIEEIVMQSCTQVGKTEFELTCLGFIIDHDPGPAMVVLPRDEDARGWAAKRVRPMVKGSPALAAHCTGKEDDLAGKLYQFDRMAVKFAGANSPADLSSDPIRFLFFDELNKYPRFSGREADPVKLAEERAKTYWNRKKVKVSTPTVENGYITREFKKTDQRYFWLPCPRCGRYQPLSFFHDEFQGQRLGWVRWPEEATAEQIKAQGLAWYECAYCAGRIEERERVGMLAAGIWCPKGCTVTEKGKVVGEIPSTAAHGYQLSVLYSPWVTWSEAAAEFLDVKDDASQYMNFVNSWLGQPWKLKAKEVKAAHLKSRVSFYQPGIVPPASVVMTAGIDVQKDHFYFVVRAWGIGEESWLVRYGRLESWEDIERFLELAYVRPEHNPVTIRLTCIDSAYRTPEVYDFCRQHRERLRPTKGYDQQATPMRRTHLDKDPRGHVIPGGLSLWTLDTTYYKDKLNRLMHAKTGEPGEWHLPSEGMEEDYYAQLTSEHKQTIRDKKTGRISERWEPVSEGRANHLLDCEVLALAGAEMLQVYALKPKEEPAVYTPPPRSGWVQRKDAEKAKPTGGGGWMKGWR